MRTRRISSLDQAAGEPTIEIRDVGESRFLLAVTINEDDSYLTGSYPSAEIAEREGLEIARNEGLDALNIVHTNA